MAFFVIIVIGGLRKVSIKLSVSTSTSIKVASHGVCDIKPDGQSGILRPFFLVTYLLFLFFFLFLSSLLASLSTIAAPKNWDLLFLGHELRFFDL